MVEMQNLNIIFKYLKNTLMLLEMCTCYKINDRYSESSKRVGRFQKRLFFPKTKRSKNETKTIVFWSFSRTINTPICKAFYSYSLLKGRDVFFITRTWTKQVVYVRQRISGLAELLIFQGKNTGECVLGKCVLGKCVLDECLLGKCVLGECLLGKSPRTNQSEKHSVSFI